MWATVERRHGYRFKLVEVVVEVSAVADNECLSSGSAVLDEYHKLVTGTLNH